MTAKPRVTVVTTVYNGASYLDRAIPSILSQDLESFEYVLVDDGSTDATLARLQEVADRDKRVRVYAPGRLGRSRALNFAFSMARGEFIAQQDMDDISYKSRLRAQMSLLAGDPELGAVGSHYVVKDDPRSETYLRKVPTDDRLIRRQMAKSIPFAHTLVMYRKEAWEAVGGYPDSSDIEDLALWVRLAARGWRLAAVPEALGEHWVHSESYWHTRYSYTHRQRRLAQIQASAVRELQLPPWMYIYAAGRLAYAHAPTQLKRLVRRNLAGSAEVDATNANPL